MGNFIEKYSSVVDKVFVYSYNFVGRNLISGEKKSPDGVVD